MRSALIALTLALAPASSFAAGIPVAVDEAVRITLPAAAGDVILGNPNIADVSVSDQRHLILVGKHAGVTNLIVTGANGRALFNRQIVVGRTDIGHVTMITGGAGGVTTNSYACAPRCESLASPESSDANAGPITAPTGAAVAAANAASQAANGAAGGVSASPGTP